MRALIFFNILFLVYFIVFDIFIYQTYINEQSDYNKTYSYNIIFNEEEKE